MRSTREHLTSPNTPTLQGIGTASRRLDEATMAPRPPRNRAHGRPRERSNERTKVSNQPSLLGDPVWRLDQRTREIGRVGVAEAREALRRASRRDADGTATPARHQAA